jgi:hypothetical protein
MSRFLPLSCILMAGLLVFADRAAALAAQDEPDSPEGTAAAIFTLRVDLDLEKARLDRRLADYAEAERRREGLRDQISSLYARIGAAVRQEEPPDAEEGGDMDSMVAKLQAAEQAEITVREELRRLREQIADSRERILTFGDRIAELRRAVPPEPEGLSGTWDITLLPSGDRAVFMLKQSGTIISGEYQQDGGWKGSLQGTLVNNKLILHRIDSKLGASSDLDGVISADLKSVKGSWQSRILSDGLPSTGSWTGRKRETRRKSEVSAP